MFQEEDLFQEEDCCFRIKTVVLRGILLFSEEDCCFKRNTCFERKTLLFQGEDSFQEEYCFGEEDLCSFRRKTCVVSGGRL